MGTKEALLQFCWEQTHARAERLRTMSQDLQESLDSETKSSSGDKHETGRAMVQLEQEKLAQQLVELERTKEILKKIDVKRISERVVLGSCVRTSMAHYFLAVSCGAAQIKDQAVYCISASSPIAQLLLGKQTGDTFEFQGKMQKVLEVI